MAEEDNTKSKQVVRKVGKNPLPSSDVYAQVEQFYPLNKKEIEFLHEYNKDLDIGRALKAAGLTKKALDTHSKQGQAILLEMREINEMWHRAIRMNSQAAATKHLELMEKFEADYDTADIKNQNKGSLSGTLARMSDANLKATGHYAKEGGPSGTKVEINIDLSGKKDEPEIKITGEDTSE